MRSWRRYGQRYLMVVPILAFALVTGCSGEQTPLDNGNPVPTRSPSTGTDGANRDGETPNNNDNEDTDSGDDGLAWVPFGPKDPTFPTPSWPAYNAFAEGKCSQLQDYLQTDDGAGLAASDLALAMVAVCKAAVLGQQDQWSIAEEHAGASDLTINQDCLNLAVKELLDRALTWHEQHPGRKPVVQIERVDGQTECGKQDATLGEGADPPPDESPTPTDQPTESAE